jgi:hypothetical protein
LRLRQKKKVWRKQNDLKPRLRADDKPLMQPLNGLSHHTNQDQDDDNGFHLFVWDMKQRLIVIMM